MSGFLVYFVTDEVDDDLARAMRQHVRALADSRTWVRHAPGFFDDPDPGEGLRTTGGYLRVEDAASTDAGALFSAVRLFSGEHQVTIELQWQERILGHIRSGTADSGLQRAISIATGR
ncbi:MAG: hypothetical protein M3P40_11075 [Actinomycetota bacterium]|nr:hypothetical protein [Actinomycetota bacterium]